MFTILLDQMYKPYIIIKYSYNALLKENCTALGSKAGNKRFTIFLTYFAANYRTMRKVHTWYMLLQVYYNTFKYSLLRRLIAYYYRMSYSSPHTQKKKYTLQLSCNGTLPCNQAEI